MYACVVHVEGLPHGCSRRDGDAGAVGSGSDNSDHEDGVEDSSDPGMGGGLWGGSCSNIEVWCRAERSAEIIKIFGRFLRATSETMHLEIGRLFCRDKGGI